MVNTKLQAAAQAHAQDMADRQFYGHQTPEGRSPSGRMRAYGYQSSMTAENIAAGKQSAEEVVAGWLKSPGHCRNILIPELREIGAGVVVQPSSERGSYWVQTSAVANGWAPSCASTIARRGWLTIQFAPTQKLAPVAREASVGGILYHSIRDPQPTWCMALLTPAGFTKPNPIRQPGFSKTASWLFV